MIAEFYRVTLKEPLVADCIGVVSPLGACDDH